MKKNEFWAIKDKNGKYLNDLFYDKFSPHWHCTHNGIKDYKVVKVRVIEAEARCEWNHYFTNDKGVRIFNSKCGNKAIQDDGFFYCPFCGLPIKEVKEKK